MDIFLCLQRAFFNAVWSAVSLRKSRHRKRGNMKLSYQSLARWATATALLCSCFMYSNSIIPKSRASPPCKCVWKVSWDFSIVIFFCNFSNAGRQFFNWFQRLSSHVVCNREFSNSSEISSIIYILQMKRKSSQMQCYSNPLNLHFIIQRN